MAAHDPTLVVLVHGAWHGAWCWSALQAELDRRGVPSIAIDLPGHGASTADLTDLYGDAACVVDVVRHLDRPVVLVGHSYGGAVITEAASDPAVAGVVEHLVYLTAFALEAGESVMDVIFAVQPAPIALAGGMVDGGDGTSTIDPSVAVTAFYADCPPAAADAAIARLGRQTGVSMGQPATRSPRDTIASTFVRCTADEAIHLLHQDLMAARCGSVVSLDTDHSPFLGRPSEVADIIEPIALGTR